MRCSAMESKPVGIPCACFTVNAHSAYGTQIGSTLEPTICVSVAFGREQTRQSVAKLGIAGGPLRKRGTIRVACRLPHDSAAPTGAARLWTRRRAVEFGLTGSGVESLHDASTPVADRTAMGDHPTFLGREIVFGAGTVVARWILRIRSFSASSHVCPMPSMVRCFVPLRISA